MNCQLNKDDILDLAAQHFDCPKSSLKMKVKNITGKYNVSDVGGWCDCIIKSNTVIYFLISFCERKYEKSNLFGFNYKGFQVLFTENVNLLNTPSEGVLFDECRVLVNDKGTTFQINYYEITKVV